MRFGDAIKSGIRRMFDYSSRSSRSEYWWFVLFLVSLIFAVAIVDSFAFGGVLMNDEELPDEMGVALGLFVTLICLLYVIGFLMLLSLGVRRLHDTDKRGWWILLSFIPFGSVILLIFYCQEGIDGPNRFGYDPLGSSMDIFD